MTENIAVTGSFASGKSYVIEKIKQMNYKVFSCDDYVKILYQNINIQNIIINEIKELEIFDKTKLASIVYNNDQERIKLERIVHPLVKEAIELFEEENKFETLIFTEVPLLFESGFDKYFRNTICVYCTEKTRLARAKARGLNNIGIFEKIKKIQLPQNIKKQKANFTIDSENEIEGQLIDIIKKILL